MRQLDSSRQGVLENEASLCRDSPCVGGFETRPYEDHSGANHTPGTVAPQCGKSGIGTVLGIGSQPL
ncbi:MAG: hypothetical protein NTV33_12445 [Coprothermobacterota bacterium]|nr:hypothetical protein [Coprothermobacterota bacterium]